MQPEALAHIARRLGRAAEAPWLHAEVARRMAERLGLIRLQPRSLIDWWSFNGAAQALLQQAYPRARVLRVEADDAVLQRGRAGGADALVVAAALGRAATRLGHAGAGGAGRRRSCCGPT